MMDKNSKIYIAGHRGLVGSAIWNNLENKGYTQLIGKSSSDLDLMNSQATTDFFLQEQPDYVFLAAAHVGGIQANNIYRADFIYNNLQIQQNVIYNAYKSGVKKLLFLGSTCIYPKQAHQPMKEDELLTNVLEYTNEPYAIAKIAGIKLCESFNIQYGTNFISVMPTNLYGPNDNFDLEKSHVLPAILRKMLLAKALMEKDWDFIEKDIQQNPLPSITPTSTQEQITIALSQYGIFPNQLVLWGSGKPKREFMWSEDMADACVYLMENVDFEDLIKDKVELRNTHINIGTGRDISIKDLALRIQKKIDYQGELLFDGTKPDGTLRKLVDVTKLHALGWTHKVDIDEGIDQLFAWYSKNL